MTRFVSKFLSVTKTTKNPRPRPDSSRPKRRPTCGLRPRQD